MKLIPGRSVHAAAETTIDAPVTAVWATLTTLDSWPHWSPGVKSMHVYGPLAVGAAFRWKVGLWTIVSTIVELNPPHGITWIGHTTGVAAEHRWDLTEIAGHVLVRTEELWHGIVPTLLRRLSKRILQAALDENVAALKHRVETDRMAQGS